MCKGRCAEIIIDNNSLNTDKSFTYLIPNNLSCDIKVGLRVLVPFGIGNKLLEGLIINITNDNNMDKNKLKCIDSILGDSEIIDETMIKLGLWMKEVYLSHYNDVFKTILPTGITKKVKTQISLTDNFNDKISSDSLTKNQNKIIRYLIENKDCDVQLLKKQIKSSNLQKDIEALVNYGIINKYNKLYSDVNKKYERYVKPGFDEESYTSIIEKISKRAFKQLQVLEYIKKYNDSEIKICDLIEDTQCSKATVNALEKEGYIKIYQKEVNRNPINRPIDKYNKVTLTAEQNKCFSVINSYLTKGNKGKFLIHGVTGSGKTEIYLQLIEEALNNGKDSIVLVPEISLTPQTVDRFVGRFGENVAILHSGLSLGERFDEWRKIKEGKVQIAIGARSAIFAPFKNLGLIIIDEEHESSYKSNMNPRYNTIEVAEKRSELEDAILVLGSATPSIETFYKAKENEIILLNLPNRINDKRMPEVEIVDMREELEAGNKSIFSRQLFKAIDRNLKENKQTILFLNRRGFSTFISCRRCGYVAKCKECDITLTYHLSENVLKCHYCGLSQRPPEKCPECGSSYIKYFGIGTQKIEELTKKYFPQARVARMDVDTTSTKGSHERILTKFKNKEVDILIGTQMISKGLDFPNVTLVGIIAADISLNLPDFRASERTFQLLTQVSGRAGRGDLCGKVILQTYEPFHYSISTAKKHDYISFYEKEIKIREAFKYPPFTNLILITVQDRNEKNCISYINTISNNILTYISNTVEGFDISNILGPNPAPISRIKSNYRWQLVIKTEKSSLDVIRRIVNRVCINEIGNVNFKNLKYSIDINPISII